MDSVINYPLCYRVMHKDKEDVTLVFHPKTQRIVFADPEYMYRQINALTLEMLTAGYTMGDTGRFESHGLQGDEEAV
jgi:hypothetical protein